MIPDLNDGVLPEGVHRCTIDEVEHEFGRFTRSDCRQRLTQTLRQYIEDVRKAQIATAVVVDGSYVTAKSEPNDVDLVLALRTDVDMSAELLPMEYNVQSERMVRRLYGFDVLPAIDGSLAYKEWIEFFSQVRGDDREQTTQRTRKGLLRVEL